jgi:hypothetical protein
MKFSAALIFLSLTTTSTFADNPIECAGPDHWAAESAYGALKNAGLVRNETTDYAKTKVILIASEQVGKDIYRQVQHITFTETTGKVIDVITVNDASSDECSISSVQVFLVSTRL